MLTQYKWDKESINHPINSILTSSINFLVSISWFFDPDDPIAYQSGRRNCHSNYRVVPLAVTVAIRSVKKNTVSYNTSQLQWGPSFVKNCFTISTPETVRDANPQLAEVGTPSQRQLESPSRSKGTAASSTPHAIRFEKSLSQRVGVPGVVASLPSSPGGFDSAGSELEAPLLSDRGWIPKESHG